MCERKSIARTNYESELRENPTSVSQIDAHTAVELDRATGEVIRYIDRQEGRYE